MLTFCGILVRVFLQEMQKLIYNEKLLSAFKASSLPENTNLWNWALLKSLLQYKERYRIFLVNKYLNLHILQYFTVLATYIKSCTVSCRMLSALPGVHFNSSHTIFHCMNGKEIKLIFWFFLFWRLELDAIILNYDLPPLFFPLQQRFNLVSFTSCALKYTRDVKLQLQ